MRVVAHHRAEHHLVVAALRAAQAAAHPGLHEHGAAFEVPARRREARHGEVAVEQRLRVLGCGRTLPRKRRRQRRSASRRDVARRHVDQLVVHQRVHALAGRKGLEGVGQRRDVEEQRIARRRGRDGVAVVGEVLQQDGRRSDGVQPNIRRCHASALVNVRTACGDR